MGTWISDTSGSTYLNTKKTHLFRTFQSLGSWLIRSRVITGFLQLLESLGSLVFHLFLSVLPILPEIHCQWNSAQTQVTKIRNLWLRNQTYKRLVQMAALISCSMAWSVWSPNAFVWVSISSITWINGSVIHFSKQIASNKC